MRQDRWGCPTRYFTLDDVLKIFVITDVCSLPLLVDADIGLASSAFNVARRWKSNLQARCGRIAYCDQGWCETLRSSSNKAIVSRRHGGSDPRGGGCETDPDFLDRGAHRSLAVEGLDACRRAQAYVEAGA